MHQKTEQLLSLWHVSPDIEPPYQRTFCPRIPNATTVGEDMTIPRICFSTSIQHCLDAINKTALHQILYHNHAFLAFQLLVKPNDAFLHTSHELLNKVPDADWTDEHWYLQPVTLTGQLFHVTEHQDYIFYRQKPDCQVILRQVLSNAGWRNSDITKLEHIPLQEALANIPYHLAAEIADIAGLHELHGFLSLQFTPELTKERSLSNGAHSTHVYG